MNLDSRLEKLEITATRRNAPLVRFIWGQGTLEQWTEIERLRAAGEEVIVIRHSMPQEGR